METDALLPWLLANKLGLYASNLLAAGLSLHAAIGVLEQTGRRDAMRLAACSAGAALAFGLARFVIVNAQLGGGIGAATLQWTWRSLGPSTLALILGDVGVIVGWTMRNRWLAGLSAVALAASFALTGHSQALDTPGLAPLAAGLHVLIAMVWSAAPFTLWPASALDDATLAGRLERFSAIAAWIVPALFLVGGWLAWVLAGGLSPLLSKPYGQLLVAKFLAALVALTMGAINKLGLTRAILAGHPKARGRLKLTLGVELAIFVIALLLVGIATTMVGPER